jgi:hypothetical protein
MSKAIVRRTDVHWIKPSSVPCNGCRACCINDQVSLHPELGDKLVDHFGNVDFSNNVAWLKHKENGECIYLAEQGCSLFGKPSRPAICVELDCRRLLNIPKAFQRAISPDVLEAARKLPPLVE